MIRKQREAAIEENIEARRAALQGDVEFIEPEEIAVARRLKTCTPPNDVLLKLTERAQVPLGIEDVQEERPW